MRLLPMLAIPVGLLSGVALGGLSVRLYEFFARTQASPEGYGFSAIVLGMVGLVAGGAWAMAKIDESA